MEITKPEKLYTCRFVNKTTVEKYILEKGKVLSIVLPDSEHEIMMNSPAAFWARFTMVRWNADGSIDYKECRDYPKPDFNGRWTITLKNDGPRDLEEMFVNGQGIFLPRGLPVTVPIDVDDRLVWYSDITIKQVVVKIPDPDRPAYRISETKIVHEKTPRSDEDIKAIMSQLEKIQAARGMKVTPIPFEIRQKLA